jgi:predicted nucleotidyltransferase
MVETEAILKAHAYLSIIKGFLDVESAYLFGSYATGSARSDSDIDIGIFTNAPVDDYFAVVKKLLRPAEMLTPSLNLIYSSPTMTRPAFTKKLKRGLN